MKIQEIREIIKLIDQSSIEKFTYEAENTKITLEKGQTVQNIVPVQVEEKPVVVEMAPEVIAQKVVQQEVAPVATPVVEKDASLHEVVSPMVGTFYAASSPDAPDFVKVGDRIADDSIVCIVEAMKLFNEIEAEISGEIVEILAKDGQLVEYGQPLFLVKKD